MDTIMLGMSLSTFTLLHVLISLIGIAAGLRMTRIEICTDKFPAFGTWHEPDAPT
jgi:hypothetical protein